MVKAFTPWGVEVNFYTLWCNGQHCKEYPQCYKVETEYGDREESADKVTCLRQYTSKDKTKPSTNTNQLHTKTNTNTNRNTNTKWTCLQI